jgi:hypothetical protein
MKTEATPGNVRLNDGLGPLPEPRWLWNKGGRPYENSFSHAQMLDYAAQQVAAERERCARLCEQRVDTALGYVLGPDCAALIRGA